MCAKSSPSHTSYTATSCQQTGIMQIVTLDRPDLCSEWYLNIHYVDAAHLSNSRLAIDYLKHVFKPDLMGICAMQGNSSGKSNLLCLHLLFCTSLPKLQICPLMLQVTKLIMSLCGWVCFQTKQTPQRLSSCLLTLRPENN